MNLSIDASLLTASNWSGVHFYSYHILNEMTDIGRENVFHLHFNHSGMNELLTGLLNKPNVTRHCRIGRRLYYGMMPFDVLRLRSKVFYVLDMELKTSLPCPASVTIYDCGEHILPTYYNNVDPLAARARTGRLLRNVPLVVTISETIKEEVQELFHVLPERILVAPPAAQPLQIEHIGKRPKNLPIDKPFFLMVNPGRSYKNWQDALSAFAIYCCQHTDKESLAFGSCG